MAAGRPLWRLSSHVERGNRFRREHFDQLNFGLYANFSVVLANSQAPTFVLIGEPIRRAVCGLANALYGGGNLC